jgi:hypothetical protein
MLAWTFAANGALLLLLQAPHGRQRIEPRGQLAKRGRGGATDGVAYRGDPSGKSQIKIQLAHKIPKNYSIRRIEKQ